MYRLLPFSLLVLALVTVMGCGNANREEWLHGTWELAYNPDGDDEDRLIFDPRGKVAIQTFDDQVIEGNYAVADNDLALLLQTDRKDIEVHFEISPDRSRLIYHSGAYYTKKN